MKKFINQHLRLILAACIIFMMAGIAWFGIVPFYGHIRETMDEIQKFHANRENKNRQLSNLPEIRAQFEEVIAHEGSLDILLTQEKIVSFIQVLERLAEETGVSISIKSGEKAVIQKKAVVETTEGEAKAKEKKKTLVEQLPSSTYIPLRLTLTGNYATLLSYLHKLETAPFALDVLAIDIHPKPEEQEEDREESARSNPFSLSPSIGDLGEPAPTEEIPESVPEPAKDAPLEAFIDVAVYVDKLDDKK